MEDKANKLSDRFLEFASGIVKLTMNLETTFIGRHVVGQLFRSGTSAGANYEEACGAQSRADFIHKLQIVLKELRESSFWLRLTMKSQLTNDKIAQVLHDEVKQLIKIIAKSLITAKKKK